MGFKTVTISAKDPKSKYLLSVYKIEEKYATGMATWLKASDWDMFLEKIKEENKRKNYNDAQNTKWGPVFENGERDLGFAVILFLQINFDTV